MTRPISINLNRTVHSMQLDKFPYECGLCHKNVDPSFIAAAFIKGNHLTSTFIEAVFQCTNLECNSLIIGYYEKASSTRFKLLKNAPILPKGKGFSDEIINVSPNFNEIYNQSFHAEQIGLTLISGIGYRKALEFLLKDYLIYLGKDEEEKILNMPLGQCINKLENHNIKEMSKRATWIGNDEAHYTRKWEDKDVNDLKKLIEVTVYFIAMDITSRRYLDEMT
ncbi:DUF4145 domain-containing protein [Peribacillus phoenicis]|uniref:DUF4145 domain-containing protein n=1 Tax=unclassified Peribacillus TaxID=2675266 RepID=UPI00399F94B4